MPIYVFRCRNCGHEFDKLVRSFSIAASPPCPSCGDESTERRPATFATAGNGSSAACIPSGGG